MNCGDPKKRTQLVTAMVEGSSVDSIVRMTGTAENTVLKLLADVSWAAYIFHDRTARSVRVRRLQCDEIRRFVGAKATNVVWKGSSKAGEMRGHGLRQMMTQNYAFRSDRLAR